VQQLLGMDSDTPVRQHATFCIQVHRRGFAEATFYQPEHRPFKRKASGMPSESRLGGYGLAGMAVGEGTAKRSPGLRASAAGKEEVPTSTRCTSTH
jgi:hypothetical protein